MTGQPARRFALTPVVLDEPVLVADQLSVRVGAGPTPPLDLTLDRSTVVVARPGPERAALLLALAGRWSGPMTGRVYAGEPTGSARRDARVLRRVTGVARIGGLVDLEDRLTVGESRDERGLAEGIGVRRARQAYADLADRLSDLPGPGVLVGSLPPAERTRLALLLARLSGPAAIVVDDLDASAALTDRDWLLPQLPDLLGPAPDLAPSLLLGTVTDAAYLPEGVASVTLDHS